MEPSLFFEADPLGAAAAARVAVGSVCSVRNSARLRRRRAIFILRSTLCFALSPLMLDMKPRCRKRHGHFKTGIFPGTHKSEGGHGAPSFRAVSSIAKAQKSTDAMDVSSWLRPVLTIRDQEGNLQHAAVGGKQEFERRRRGATGIPWSKWRPSAIVRFAFD